MKRHVAIVEDDPDLAENLERFLNFSGYNVSKYLSSKVFLAALRQTKFDLVIAHWSNDNIQGIEIVKRINKFYPRTRTLVLSARSNHSDVALALENGADDYITKPVDANVLRLRIKLLMPNCQDEIRPSPDNIVLGPYLLHQSRSKIYFHGEDIKVSKREFSLLWLFFQHPNQIIPRQFLATTVFNRGADDQSRTVAIYIAGLRKKLRLDTTFGLSLRASYGLGYSLIADINVANAAHPPVMFSA